MIRSWPSVTIGFVIPTVAILGGVLTLGRIHAVLFGFPVVFLWIFLCFPLTTLCLWVSWRFFDRSHYPDEEKTA